MRDTDPTFTCHAKALQTKNTIKPLVRGKHISISETFGGTNLQSGRRSLKMNWEYVIYKYEKCGSSLEHDEKKKNSFFL